MINASTQGTAANPGSPIGAGLLHEGLWVADVLYSPRESTLLRDARLAGARTTNGGPMLVNQAALSFEIFHGLSPDVGRMWAHFIELMEDQW